MQNFYSDKLTLKQLAGIPFFEGLPDDVLEMFNEIIDVETYRPGSYVFEESDDAREMFFILQGSVKVIKKNFRGTEKIIVELTAPQFFGEMALIDRGKRSTSVVASTTLHTAVLSWEALDKDFSNYNPDLAVYTYRKIAQTLSLRLRKVNALYVHNAPEF